MATSRSELTSVSRRPLCWRYVLCIPDAAGVRLRDADGLREESLYWLLGWLVDGECEPLGACVGAQALPGLMADLKARGVQRLWHVAALGDGRAQEGAAAALAVAGAFPDALTSSRPRVLPVAAAVARDVRAALLRAIRRHGPFEDEAAAVDFAALALRRAERRLDRERLVATGRSRLDPDALAAAAA